MPRRTLIHLVQKGLKLRKKRHTWDSISIDLNILTKDGRPDPGLAKRIIADGYEPKRLETITRLELPVVCPICDRRMVKFVRHVPTWLEEVVKNLRQLEAKANVPPEENRVYARGGKRVHVARDRVAFESNSQSPLLN
jgi:hypothetical protein